MTERPRFFDDLAGLAGGALSAASGLRDEMSAMVRTRVEEAIRRLDLVRRDEFDAVMELASRARAEADALTARVARLEEIAHRSEAAETSVPSPADGEAEQELTPDQEGSAPD
ncbi:MAG TPA: accessory factor UbiK family protein [Acidiphilium sp.]|nr:accessory factor UbiK family protein [Acidiphilium sp.]